MTRRPICRKCCNYYVTHDPSQPFGCRAMGFKSVQNPAVMVFRSSGIECQLFKQKECGRSQTQRGNTGDLLA